MLQRQFVEGQATLGSTTGPTLFDVPTTHFPSDEPRAPGSAASVVPDIPLPDVTGGTTNMPPPWRPSVRPHRGPIQSGPRPHHRSDYRTGPAARHYPKSSSASSTSPKATSPKAAPQPGDWEHTWEADREWRGTSHVPNDEAPWRRARRLDRLNYPLASSDWSTNYEQQGKKRR